MYAVYLRPNDTTKWEYHYTFRVASDAMKAMKLVREAFPTASVLVEMDARSADEVEETVWATD